MDAAPATKPAFTGYEKFIIALLTVLQFTVILDFMVLSPLGAILMPALRITPQQFGWVVSAYAFSAGVSGIAAASFADKFDRKKMLLVFYAGFLAGTFLCGIAPDYRTLLAARIFTGIFGGVISAICFAIVTDLFAMQVRGRVMGFLQMAFASSQVLGIPLGLYAAAHFGWHWAFLTIVALGIPVGIVMVIVMRPVDEHLKIKSGRNPLQHLWNIISTPRYLRGFAATTLLATGGFMLMPFGSAFVTGNLGIAIEHLPTIYLATGITAMIAGPVAGKLSDTIGKYKVFTVASSLALLIAIYYTQLGITPLWHVIVVSCALFTVISARIVSASALISGVPAPQDRGAYMGVGSALQQISGGISAAIAGMIVIQIPGGALLRYDLLGYVVAGAIVVTIIMMYSIHRMVTEKA